MKTKIYFFPAVFLFLLLSLVSCAKNVSSTTYEASEVGVTSKVVSGEIISKRVVNIDDNSGAGGLAGTVAGAAAGSSVGGSPAGHVVGAVGGAVIGGVAGNAIDKAINRHQGFEYIIKLKSGSVVSIVQEKDVELKVHQHVLVIYGAMTRIIPDETVSSRTRV